MNELMVHVERCVRPIVASAVRKDRMREELLAHLTALVDEECKHTNDEQAALVRALERLGEPAALTRELQASVSRRDRAFHAVEHWFSWHAPESSTRYAIRLGVIVLLSNLALAALIVLPAYFLGSRTDGTSLERLWNGVSFLLVESAAVVPLALLYFKIRDSLLGRPGVTQSFWRALGFAGLFGVVAFASGVIWPLIGLGNVEATLALFPFWLSSLFVLPPLTFVFTLISGRQQLRHTEWECLDLSAAVATSA